MPNRPKQLEKQLQNFLNDYEMFTCNECKKTKPASAAVATDYIPCILIADGNIICVDCWVKLDSERK